MQNTRRGIPLAGQHADHGLGDGGGECGLDGGDLLRVEVVAAGECAAHQAVDVDDEAPSLRHELLRLLVLQLPNLFLDDDVARQNAAGLEVLRKKLREGGLANAGIARHKHVPVVASSLPGR